MNKIATAFKLLVIMATGAGTASMLTAPNEAWGFMTSAFTAATAPVQPPMMVNGRQVVRLDVTDMAPGEYPYIIIKNADLTVEFVEDTSQQIVLSPGAPPDNPGPDTTLEEVRNNFIADGELPVFTGQVALMREVLIVPVSTLTFAAAYNHVNGVLVRALGDYASPHWDPWRLPFVDDMEAEREGDQDLAELRKLVEAANASLGGV